MEGESQESASSTWQELPGLIAAAHELKSPLVTMRQLSLELSDTVDPERAEVLNQRLRFSLEQSLRLVEQLSMAPRLSDGDFACEPVQVQAVCDDITRQFLPLANHMSVDIDFRTSRRPLVALANRDLLSALLVNLCDNALCYTPQGGRVNLRSSVSKYGICMSVQDQGPPISLAAFRQLKQRLGRSVQPLDARPRSSGLGLWIAGQYADAMGAKLSLTRHRKGGLTFSVMLPKSEQLALL